MTCVVGIVENGKVYMGADSAAVSDSSCTIRKDPKLFRKGDMLMGFSGPYRLGQVLRFDLTPPDKPTDMDDYEYLCTLFIEELRNTLDDKGCMSEFNGMDDTGEANILIGWNGHLYRIDRDFQIGETVDRYDAIGSGEDLARGVLYMLHHKGHMGRSPPKTRMHFALSAAQYHSTAVREPFIYDEI